MLYLNHQHGTTPSVEGVREMREWISVENRTPEIEHECTTSETMISDAVIVSDIDDFHSVGFAHYHKGGYWTVYGGEHDFMNPLKVTHWMPMPKHPERK